MSSLVFLKSASSLADLAALLNFSASGLSFIIYKQTPNEKYQKFLIPKKMGGTREICAPTGAMKAVQRELATLLSNCRDEIEKAHPRKPLSHGYRKGLSIITNAQSHTARRFLLNVDLVDFFPTFNFGRVRGFFLKDKHFELNEKVATVIAQIACFENSLPQGSPCSPIIADLIAHILDVKLVRLAKNTQVTYSRYADDLSFSTNKKIFPTELAKLNELVPGQWVAGNELLKEIEKAGFNLNPLKTRMQVRGSRQVVTGLTVNTKVNISQHYWRNIRSMCKSLYDTGEYYLPITKNEIENGVVPEILSNLNPLAGMLSHAHYVKMKSGRYPDSKNKSAVYGQNDFMRFWFFKLFVAATRPLVLCEGTTDNVYLRNAMRQLSSSYPQLAVKTSEGYQFGVSLFNYENSVHKILGINGGIGAILKFVYSYKKSLSYYKFKQLLRPIIVLVDNDTALGAKTTNELKKHFGVSITHKSENSFFHLTDNLYLVKTPLVSGKDLTCIEDLFEPSTLQISLEGKVFHPNKEGFDQSKHIGKVPFATKIIEPNAASIPWTGFAPLLDRIVAVLDNYAPSTILPID